MWNVREEISKYFLHNKVWKKTDKIIKTIEYAENNKLLVKKSQLILMKTLSPDWFHHFSVPVEFA